MKIRCLLIDEEPSALKVLAGYIYCINGLEMVGLCQNATEALEILQQKNVDVIFLDIKNSHIVGAGFIKHLSHPPKLIFVTVYKEYAVDGFEVDAVDYIIKPVSFERFLKAVTKLQRTMRQQALYDTKEHKFNADAFVYLNGDKDSQQILVNDILYLEGWKDYTKVYLSSGMDLLVKHSINSLEVLLSEYNFLRVHRSFLVSIIKIKEYNSLFVKMQEEEIPIGGLYKQMVIDRLHKK